MIITAWIILIVFGVLAITNIKKYFTNSLNIAELVLMLVSIIMSAVSAGVIFGGLRF